MATVLVRYVPDCCPLYDPKAIVRANLLTASGAPTTHSRRASICCTSSRVRRFFSVSVLQTGYPSAVGYCRISIRVHRVRSGGDGPADCVRRDRKVALNAAIAKTTHKAPRATAATKRPADILSLFLCVDSEPFMLTFHLQKRTQISPVEGKNVVFRSCMIPQLVTMSFWVGHQGRVIPRERVKCPSSGHFISPDDLTSLPRRGPPQIAIEGVVRSLDFGSFRIIHLRTEISNATGNTCDVPSKPRR